MTAALLDTSVIIDIDEPLVEAIVPDEIAVSVITVAELLAGEKENEEAARRVARIQTLQRIATYFDPLPFDRSAAESYAEIVKAVRAIGRSPRRRAMDLEIAAIAHSNGLDLYTRDKRDFRGLSSLLTVVIV